ncbi:hypothetical protein KDC22_13955 [Paenibacillus tritici]|uniref:hypothetical protein n=1 Tax=Paenibacillus tritici TaxID=1873425 RepID=UPI001BA69589|nr:hypothetical protein [Paenibacillus tritici]QUL57477.1 hypothetical protein KDC22_13955 [Paenibacillus tritici]
MMKHRCPICVMQHMVPALHDAAYGATPHGATLVGKTYLNLDKLLRLAELVGKTSFIFRISV